MESGSLSVAQSGQNVVVLDEGGGEGRLVDTASAEVSDTFPLPAGDVEVALAGDVAVVTALASGDVWITSVASLAAFDPASPPDLTLGAGGATAVSEGGTVFAVSAASGSVFSVDPDGLARGERADARPLDVATDDELAITAVGDRWVVLDRSAGRLITADGTVPVDLAAGTGAGDAGGSPQPGDEPNEETFDPAGNPPGAESRPVWLQSPSGDADSVIAATPAALLSVTLADGTVEVLSDGHSGTSTAPVQIDGCWFAAWTDGRSWTGCAGAGAEGRSEGGTTVGGPGLADGVGFGATTGTPGTNAEPAEPAETAEPYEPSATARPSAASGGADGVLPGAASGDRLVFRTNGTGGVLLSDAASGRSWDVTRGNAPIDDWNALLPEKPAQPTSARTAADDDQAPDPDQQPPVAGDDELGARPGRSVVLPVLQNDFDPNDDVIVIDSVALPEGAGYTVDLVSDDQQLQLTTPAAGPGGEAGAVLEFGYTVSDGRGGTDDAVARVTLRADGENTAPVQSTRETLDLALGGRAELDLRGDWYDPDGDAFYLQSAAVAAPDSVSWTPEGVVTVTDAGATTGTKEVTVTVGDGVTSTTGSFTVEVHTPDQVPLRAEGFVVLARVGQAVELSPLAHVTGGDSGLRLAAVPAREGFTIAPDFTGGTVRVTADTVGSTTLDYAVGDGSRSATGVIRVVATVPPDANARPVTVPHSAFVRQGSEVPVDVLAGDFDPAGGVLIVTGADSASDPALRVEVIEQRMLRVTLTGPLNGGRATAAYTVTNGFTAAQGTVTVVEIPEPVVRQPPVAVPDRAAVRVGDVVDIPVLANDVHPDGDRLSLDPALVAAPAGQAREAGLLFASGDRLRFLAPPTPGDVTAVYRVDAPDGQWATAAVTISVREADATVNAAPVPALVTARVIAGETVRISVPIEGIDPDGDSVQFLGIDSVPAKGQVVQTGPDWIEFAAGEYSSGTDTFGYTVADRLGAKASGTVRVGISPRLDSARNPVATPDEVRVRPGRTVLLRVLDNDSSPGGSPLSIAAVEPLTGPGGAAPGGGPGSASAAETVSIEGALLSIRAPEQPGRYSVVYTVADERGGTGSSFATIEVDPDAPLARPVVDDTLLTLSDILDRSVVDVDVLQNVFFAEGPPSDLTLTVPDGFAESARVVDGRIRVRIAAAAQVIPFTVAHPDDPAVRSSGFVWVPGTDDALPQLRQGAPVLQVESGALLEIDVNDVVVAVGDRPVRIADANSVRATHADGSPLVVGDDTLAFRSADRYFGPASLSFEVTDGDGPSARRVTLVLPVTVTPRENQPPAFAGAVVEFEPGQQKAIDLARLTTSATPGPLAFALQDARPEGFQAVLIGSTLTVTAAPGAPIGTTGELGVQVTANGDAAAGTSGTIAVSVVPSTRPIAVPAVDAVVAPRGRTTTVDVLANDAATNPFPATPLRVVAVRGLDRSRLPAGVSIAAGSSDSVLEVTVAPDAPAADIAVQYQVLDATGDPSRAAWGTVRISVADRPSPVTGLSVTGFGDRSITVAFSPGPANNSPITGFDVEARTAAGAVTTSRCASTSCDVGTPGNGPGDAVTLSVSAVNAIGSSDARSYGVPVWSDLLPAAPGTPELAPLDGALAVRWAPASVPAGGSAVRQYDVTANGVAVATVDAASCAGDGCSTTVSGLQNGASVDVVVTARNGAYPPLAAWPSAGATGTPYGAPAASAVTAVATPEAGPGTVVLSWPGFEGNGSAVAGYYAQALRPGTGQPAGAQACSVSTPAPGRPTAPEAGGDVIAQQALGADAGSASFTGLTDVDAAYGFVVWGYNAAGCVASSVVTAVAYPSPGQVQAAGVSVAVVQSGTAFDAQVLSAPTPGTLSGDTRYRVRQVDAGGAPVGEAQAFTLGGFPRSLTGGAFGEAYRFQLQACNRWGGAEVCGAFSDTVTAPEPSLTFAFDRGPDYDGTRWTWAGEPSNGALTPAYTCGSADITPAGEPGGQVVLPGSCTPGAPAAPGDAGLSVQIGDHHYVYRG
nr:Ig-like domain-containing protein [Herbiconiux sp. VKM Ac-2851]